MTMTSNTFTNQNLYLFKVLSDVNDAALLILTKNVRLDDHILPVCLPTLPFKTYSSRKATAIGWGKSSSGKRLSEELNRVNITVFPNSMCSKAWDGGIYNVHICAGEGGSHDVCIGDSGGGLVVKENSGRQ